MNIICITPIKNESWILDRFIQCASQWADYIIIADQGSTDDSRTIASSYPKVILIENNAQNYDEGYRQRLLLAKAREIPGERLIIALDADEMLTANWSNSPEWEQMKSAARGTIFRFSWLNVWPDFKTAWVPGDGIPFGFIDDGREHQGQVIHSTRIPVTQANPSILLKESKVLHYQYTNWPRMKSKQRWYQCWEKINNPNKRPIQIYRQYHHMDAPPPTEVVPINPEWFTNYEEQHIDMRTIPRSDFYHWDRELLAWFEKYGIRTFSRLGIWDADWKALAQDLDVATVEDPRTSIEKYIHRWLAATQGNYTQAHIRFWQRLLILFGW